MSDDAMVQSAFEFGHSEPNIVSPDDLMGSDDAALIEETSTDRTEIRAQLRVMDVLEALRFPTCIARTGQPYDLISHIQQLEVPAIGAKGLITFQVKGTEKPYACNQSLYQFHTKRTIRSEKNGSSLPYGRYLPSDLDVFAFAPLPENSVLFCLPRDLVSKRSGTIPYGHFPNIGIFRHPNITQQTLKYCLGQLAKDREAILRSVQGGAA